MNFCRNVLSRFIWLHIQLIERIILVDNKRRRRRERKKEETTQDSLNHCWVQISCAFLPPPPQSFLPFHTSPGHLLYSPKQTHITSFSKDKSLHLGHEKEPHLKKDADTCHKTHYGVLESETTLTHLPLFFLRLLLLLVKRYKQRKPKRKQAEPS